jgi:nucleotide-binding universal stress UspA family protein
MRDTVIVGYDRTPPSDLALDVAAREAALRGVPLTVLSAYLWLAGTPPTGAAVVHAELGGPAELGADLLVVGSRGRGGFAALLLGSVSARTVGMARCPVMVARGPGGEPRGRVLAAVDVYEPCGDVLDFAFAEAARRRAALEVVHAWEPPWIIEYGRHGEGIGGDIRLVQKELEDLLAREVDAARARCPGIEPFAHVAAAAPGAAMVRAAALCDVAVLGARRLADERHRLAVGPLARTMLHHADCPVALVPYG